MLTQSDIDNVARSTGCESLLLRPDCANDCWSNRFRTFTSVCNNRKEPHWGASNTALARWLPARYEDGISLPLGWTPDTLHSGFPVPLVRQVSNTILRIPNMEVTSDTELSYLFMQWGQWLDHDMSLSPLAGSIETFEGGIDCESTCIQGNPCFPIKIPPNDTRSGSDRECMPFFRSAPACDNGHQGTKPKEPNIRQQINSITSFLDMSELYGSTDCLANSLRNLTSEEGLLAVNQEFTDNGREYLPFTTALNGSCGSIGEGCDTDSETIPCFIAGDVRVNEQLGLLSFHTIFLREHNRVARELKTINPHWNGDRIYHETRKILGAFQQIITFRDYIPRLIGPEAIARFLPEYKGYDESVNPSIANVISSACFRFGHLTVQPFLFRFDENFQDHPQFPTLPLHEAFFVPWRMIRQGGADPIVRGLIGNPSKLQKQDMMMTDELREMLFEMVNHLGLDLGSLNMQRSRDHGITGYNAWRKFCNLSQPKNKAELSDVLRNSELAEKFIELYGTPDNIDIWIGAISEPFVEGGRVGPLLACLIGQQFQKLRDGDRFWWENEGVFTQKQRQALTNISLSRIICENTGIQQVPVNAFQFNPFPEGYVQCNRIPKVNLEDWKERPQLSCGKIPTVSEASFSICDSSVKYTCQHGFTMEGSDTIDCMKNKQWNRKQPRCSKSKGFQGKGMEGKGRGMGNNRKGKGNTESLF
ncbi:eosinophil peroxidase-like [Hypanus sabinus]|uniref:eosinophil peroxidase-like n=1 Tax=Hypanus sabinus TaxID=79690 RepID=UPI0028C3D8C9|nr:eosinophil peroxidase-like [Hypanus sabinus]